MPDTLRIEESLFYLWRRELVASMTLVDILPEGDLYYYYSSSCSLAVWVVRAPSSLLVAYCGGESPEEIRSRVRLWDEGLKAWKKPRPPRDIGFPVYAAEYDPSTERLVVAWCSMGDWSGLAMEGSPPLPKRWYQLPGRWPETYRRRIAKLAKLR